MSHLNKFWRTLSKFNKDCKIKFVTMTDIIYFLPCNLLISMAENREYKTRKFSPKI